MINLMDLKSGEGVPAHVNHETDAVFVVLEGEVAFRCGEKSVVAGAGSMIFAPRGVPRTWAAVGDRQARTLECPLASHLDLPGVAVHQGPKATRNTKMRKTKLTVIALAAAAVASGERPDLNRLPLTFERIQGQAPAPVEWVARGKSAALQFMPGAVAMISGGSSTLMRLVGAQSAARWQGEHPLEQVSNCLRGSDRNKWRAGVEQFGRLRCAQVYQGIDLVFYGTQGLFVAIDGMRAVYLAGHTYSNDLPVVAEYVKARGGNSDAFVQRICDPVIFLSEHSVDFACTQGGEAPQVRKFGARACMDLALKVEMVDAPSWLDVAIKPARNGSMPVEASVKPEELEPGEFTATVRISSPESWFEPKVVNVTLRVSAPRYARAMPISAFTKIAPSAVGMSTFQPMFMSWS
jgi:hypothetical protein